MSTVNKSPRGTASILSPVVAINTKKLKMGEQANVGDFSGVRTTVTSAKEGRLKVDAGATPKKKILKKALKNLK